MRKLVSVIAAGALLASTTLAFADSAQTTANSSQPLAPGGAAGVHNAELEWGSNGLLIGVGLVGLTVGTIIVLTNNGGHNTTHTATTTTP